VRKGQVVMPKGLILWGICGGLWGRPPPPQAQKLKNKPRQNRGKTAVRSSRRRQQYKIRFIGEFMNAIVFPKDHFFGRTIGLVASINVKVNIGE